MTAIGRFAWFELVTPDVEDAKAFWSEVAGFGLASMDMGAFRYEMLTRGENNAAGVVRPQMPEVPPHWLSYWEVDDVDARSAAVKRLGGAVIVPPTDIPGVGRFAIAQDPQGAVFALFKGTGGDDAPSAFEWNELWTRDAEAALAFYTAALGLGRETTTMPNGPYHLLKAGDVSVAGVLASPDDKVPPMWLPYLRVDDVDDGVARVQNHGGRVIAPLMDIEGVGRFGIVADRQGAVLGFLRPAPR